MPGREPGVVSLNPFSIASTDGAPFACQCRLSPSAVSTDAANRPARNAVACLAVRGLCITAGRWPALSLALVRGDLRGSTGQRHISMPC
jgi:hypothetical protein